MRGTSGIVGRSWVGYNPSMADARKVNLADPDYEPTDEDLQRLAHEAFEDVPRRRAAALERLHARIAEDRRRLEGERAARVAK